MTSRTPPRLATWLLEHLGRGYCGDSLVGDLLEQYARGRSSAWYWRQVLAALLTNVQRTLRAAGPSFATALAAGWVVLWGSHYLTRYTSAFVRGAYRQISWVLGLDHFAYQVAAVVTFAADLIWFGLIWTAQGYVIGRLHSHYRKTALLLFLILFAIAPSYWDITHRLMNALQYPNGGWLSKQLAFHVFWRALNVVCVMVGGLYLVRHCQTIQSKAARH